MTQTMCWLQDACFVRFLGHVTGRAGLAQLAGTFVADPRRNFTVNQSVRAQVVQVLFLPTVQQDPILPLFSTAHACLQRVTAATVPMSTTASEPLQITYCCCADRWTQRSSASASR